MHTYNITVYEPHTSSKDKFQTATPVLLVQEEPPAAARVSAAVSGGGDEGKDGADSPEEGDGGTAQRTSEQHRRCREGIYPHSLSYPIPSTGYL